MDKLIDYGWFAILVKPLLWALKQIQRVVKNWGVAIILDHDPHQDPPLPADAQAARLDEEDGRPPAEDGGDPRRSTPRRSRATRSARLKMNEETMALYKQEGVNPAGGCLPLLLQMPILIAFYNLLAPLDRAAARAVHALDHGPLGEGPLLRHADPDDADDVAAAADDAGHRRRRRCGGS